MPIPTLPEDVEHIVQLLAHPQPMRRGSLTERYVKCSKPGCSCAEEKDARHGPYFSLTRAVAGRTHSRFLPASQSDLVKSQIEAAHRFRKNIDAYWEACEHWADAQLEKHEAAEEVAKKGASNNPSKRRPKRK
jgi:hypothetical protein